MIVTDHAVARYIERIAAVDWATARTRLERAARAIDCAAAFGAHCVRTHDAKLMLDGDKVVTVLPRKWIDHSDLNLAQRQRRFADHRADNRARRAA